MISLNPFAQTLAKVAVVNEGGGRPRRYILKRNPVRAQQRVANRQRKKAAVQTQRRACNERLARSVRAKLAVAHREISAEFVKLRLDSWLRLRKRRGQRQLERVDDATALQSASKFA